MIIGAAALTAIIAVAGVAANSYASNRGEFGENFKGNISAEDLDARRETMQVKRTAMDEIFTNNDYEAWKTLMEEKVSEVRARADAMAAEITEENFSKLSEVHKLMQDGNYEEAGQLREELGFGRGMGKMGPKSGGRPMNLGK